MIKTSPNDIRSVQVVVFWVLILCSDVVGYQFFRRPQSSETAVSYHITTWYHSPEDHNSYSGPFFLSTE